MSRTTQRSFRAMGSDCHLIVVDGPDAAIDRAHERILDLEQRWSRFVDTSEISVLNTHQGVPMVVSDETVRLLDRALEAKRLTGGRFDATVLGDVMRAGYDRSFDTLGEGSSGVSTLFAGPITVIGPTVMLAEGTGFDPGGIGKGLAADIVVREMLDAGANGVSVNLGGDVRVEGHAPNPEGWAISVDHPRLDRPLVTLGLTAGAVATSTSLIRRWEAEGEARHHLIEPSTGRSAETDITFATAVASEAWRAEAFAKACLLAGTEHWRSAVAGTGIEALVVTDDGAVLATPGLEGFTDHIPTRLTSLVGQDIEQVRS